MKKLVFLMLVIVLSNATFAKKVKFSVDMSDYEVSAYGVHVTGDFQALAGYDGGDWMPNTTLMVREAESDIFSVVVDIPAHRKYEFRFVNGDQFYETEFVPLESRVGYDYNDNRWIYVDSTTNDTTFSGAIVFGSNAPKNMVLIRFLVNMQMQGTISNDGVFVDLSEIDPELGAMKLYNFEGSVYEIIAFADPGTYGYRFSNGSLQTGLESVPADCATSGLRQVNASDDIALEAVCFAACTDCVTGFSMLPVADNLMVFPNPVSNALNIMNARKGNAMLSVVNAQGALMIQETVFINETSTLQVTQLNPGFYKLIISGTDYLATCSFIKL
jgi:hypothetical protein